MLNVIFFLLFLTGVVFIVYSVIKFKPAENTATVTEEMIEKLQTTITDADNAMEEISKLSQSIFDEMAEKYKELLYIYSLIEKKQNKTNTAENAREKNAAINIASIPNVPENIAPKLADPEKSYKPPQASAEFGSFMTAYNSVNPKHAEIKELALRGMPVAEIAKSLNLGQGEVRLVLELGKTKYA